MSISEAATGVTTGTTGTIVVGVDGSPTSERAVEWAATQAELDHRVLTLVHAGTSRDALGAAAARSRTSHPGLVVQQVLSGPGPQEALLGLAADAAMVVVGSHGRGPARSLLLGSVGVALTKLAPCPVVVVRPEAGSGSGSGGVTVLRHGVLVGVHGTDPCQPAVEVAFDLAASRSWPLTVLQCSDDEDYERRNAAIHAALVDVEAKHPDVVVTRRMQHGFIDQCLVELSSSMHAVVVGSLRSTRLNQIVWGSLASAVVEHADGVVVVVPPNHVPDARLSVP